MSRRRIRKNGTPKVRHGLSLMEVVLALAILGVTIAVIGELIRIGARSAMMARDLTQAQLLCESKMAEIASGIDLPQAVPATPFDWEPQWLYTIEADPTDQTGLLLVRVTVEQEVGSSDQQASFTLVRFLADPDYLADLQAAEEALGDTTAEDTGG